MKAVGAVKAATVAKEEVDYPPPSHGGQPCLTVGKHPLGATVQDASVGDVRTFHFCPVVLLRSRYQGWREQYSEGETVDIRQVLMRD